MVSTQWCLNPSAQRWSSAYPSAQRWSWASPFWEVGNILNDGPCDWGPLAGTTEGHLAHRGGHGVHIGHPVALSFTMQLALIVTTVGSTTGASCKGSGGASWASTTNRSLCKQVVAPQKPGGGITCCEFPSIPVGDVGSDLMFWICSSALQCWAILSLELLLQGLHLELQEIKGICLAAVTSLEGCNTSLHPGNQFGECSLLVDSLFGVQELLGSSGGLTMGAASSLATFTTASSMGELVDAGWALWGMVFSDWVVRNSSGRAMPLKTASSGKKK